LKNPSPVFRQRISDFQQQEKYYHLRYQWVSWLRILIFLGGVGLSIYFFFQGQDAAGFISLGVAYLLFILVMRVHSRIGYSRNHFRFLRQINEQEIRRAEGHLNDFEGGAIYRDALHPYTSDLDVFGPHSLFQLLNRGTTTLGQDRLAQWLQKAAAAPDIQKRQEAVAELTPDIDWRQHFQARAWHYRQEVRQPLRFFEWLKAPDFFSDKFLLKIATFVLPVLTIAAWVWWFNGGSIYAPLGLMVLQALLAYKFSTARDDYYEQSSGMYEVLRSYTSLLEHIETRPFQALMAVDLQKRLQVEGRTASGRLRQLANIVEYLSARLNATISIFLNTILMWDFFWMLRLENWKKRMAVNLEPVLEVLGQFEALTSLASYQYAHPSYAVPDLSDQPFEVEAKGLGHPLIFAAERITNDFFLAGAGKTVVITGSNMSGKSTFLRTLGLNMVLAMAGGAACAARFRLYPVQVFTGMRTEDNLAEHTSSFYAELKRLKQVLDLTQTGTPVFYLLDEILKGTNSRDRHLGAVALIRQLHKRNATGLISTHDLELGKIQEELPEHIQNFSFNSTIEGDEILFDYKLHEGVCHSFNASKLMQKMGIEI
jgi:ABC-type multidrug transport system fused ATPase/permease subunit